MTLTLREAIAELDALTECKFLMPVNPKPWRTDDGKAILDIKVIRS